jgi:hypothetical protein
MSQQPAVVHIAAPFNQRQHKAGEMGAQNTLPYNQDDPPAAAGNSDKDPNMDTNTMNREGPGMQRNFEPLRRRGDTIILPSEKEELEDCNTATTADSQLREPLTADMGSVGTLLEGELGKGEPPHPGGTDMRTPL